MVKDATYYNAVTEQIIGCAYTVGRALGPGFIEKVYENAMIHELEKARLKAESQKSIKVYYDGIVVGDYFADVVVDDEIIVELKVVKALDNTHLAQCLHYLKATGNKLGLLVNFGASSVQIKRVANGL